MEFRILGPLEVLDEGRALRLGGRKQRALLAILLIHADRAVSTDRLIDDLWGEEPPITAMNAVQVYISQLRKTLERGGDRRPGLIVTQPPGYAIHLGDEELDLHRFERLAEEGRSALASGETALASVKLREALALWRGDPLADFTYEPFAQAVIERLGEERLAVLEDRFQADLDIGRHGELVGELEAFTAEHPLREGARGHLMLALYRSGRQAEALEAFQEARTALAEGLGIDPSPQLQQLHDRILRQDPDLEPPAQPTPAGKALPEQLRHARGGQAAAGGQGPQRSQETAATFDEERVLPVTVLVADVLGLTSLGERLTSDEARAIVAECLETTRAIVESFGGFMHASDGGPLRASFGLPIPHEDDHERGGRAALSVVRRIRDYAREVEVAWGVAGPGMRIGLHAGRAIVASEALGAVAQVPEDLMSLATQLQGIAEVDTVIVSDTVARRLLPTFALERLDDLTAEGLRHPLPTWRLIEERPPGGRFLATPFVGRSEELARLEEILADLRSGRGRIVAIQGDPGLGKSRLLAEWEAAVDDVLWLEGRCLPYTDDIPSRPFVEALRGWLGALPDEHPVSVRAKLRTRLEAFDELSREILPPLERMLEVGPQERPGLDGDSRAEIARAYADWLSTLCREQPVVLAIEDVNDADPRTRTLIEELLPLTDRAPLSFVFTSRPDPASHGWNLLLEMQSRYLHRMEKVRLQPLGGEDAKALIEALAPTGSLDEQTFREILARAEGNPLYVEELLALLSDARALERKDRWTLTVTSATLLPQALEGLLIARIQQLPPAARSIAEVAAIVGREFSIPLLERVRGGTIDETVTALLRAEVFIELERFPELRCAFRHGLLREAALATLTPARSRELHGRVAQALEELGERTPGATETLALHYYRSNRHEKALEHLERAAQDALDSEDGVRARALLTRAQRAASKAGDAKAAERIERTVTALAPSPESRTP